LVDASPPGLAISFKAIQQSKEDRGMLLENKKAVILGGGGFIGGAVARTFSNVTGGTFPSYMSPAFMTTQRQGRAA
jgi:hypothetical protein